MNEKYQSFKNAPRAETKAEGILIYTKNKNGRTTGYLERECNLYLSFGKQAISSDSNENVLLYIYIYRHCFEKYQTLQKTFQRLKP